MYGLFHRASKAAVALPHVHFRPWVGSGYECGIAGRKVLVLGGAYCSYTRQQCRIFYFDALLIKFYK